MNVENEHLAASIPNKHSREISIKSPKNKNSQITKNNLIAPYTYKIPINKHNSFMRRMRLFVNTDNTNSTQIKYSYLESSGRFNAAYRLRPKNFGGLIRALEELGYRRDMARAALFKAGFRLREAEALLDAGGGCITVSPKPIKASSAAPPFETRLDRPMERALFGRKKKEK